MRRDRDGRAAISDDDVPEEKIDALMREFGYEEVAPRQRDTKKWRPRGSDDPQRRVSVPIKCPPAYLARVLKRIGLPRPDWLPDPDAK